MYIVYGSGLALAVILALLFTPLVKRLALAIGAVDAPNHRKVHTRIMPRLGGLAIYLAFVASCLIVAPFIGGIQHSVIGGLLIGGSIVVLIGALDDKYDLSPRFKLLGQIAAAAVVVSFGLKIDLVNVPFGHSTLYIGWLSIPLTIFWIVGVTNAINLIDGLDGLAAGVSAIATGTILVMALMMGNPTGILLSVVLLGSIIGFLYFNFVPAKIFMGDSGALFLGFSLATLSVLGYKQATIVSFIIPMLILGVPLSDTFFAIIRRWVNKKPISSADKSHLHHCLLQLGFSHRTTVLLIYGISTLFALSAILLSKATLWVAIIFIIMLALVLEVGAEAIGIIGKSRRPLLHLLNRLRIKTMRLMRMPK